MAETPHDSGDYASESYERNDGSSVNGTTTVDAPSGKQMNGDTLPVANNGTLVLNGEAVPVQQSSTEHQPAASAPVTAEAAAPSRINKKWVGYGAAIGAVVLAVVGGVRELVVAQSAQSPNGNATERKIGISHEDHIEFLKQELPSTRKSAESASKWQPDSTPKQLENALYWMDRWMADVDAIRKHELKQHGHHPLESMPEVMEERAKMARIQESAEALRTLLRKKK